MGNRPITQKLKSVLQFLVGIAVVIALGIAALELTPGVKTPEGWHTIQPPNDVMAMAEFQDMLWAGGRDGLYVIDQESFKLVEEIELEIPLLYVSSILVSRFDHSLWVGHLNGLSQFDGNTWKHFSTADGLAGDQVLSLAETETGDLLVGTSDGLSWHTSGGWRNFTTSDGLASNSVDVIAIDSQGRIWLGSRNTKVGGASMNDGQGWYTFTIENGLIHNSVNTIFFDQEGRIWFGCGFSHLGGIAMFDGGNWRYMDSKDGLPADHIRLIYQDSFNIIWISTEYSGIIATNNLKPGTLITPENGLVGWEVKSMLMDSHSSLWFGTERGITVIEEWAYRQLLNE